MLSAVSIEYFESLKHHTFKKKKVLFVSFVLLFVVSKKMKKNNQLSY